MNGAIKSPPLKSQGHCQKGHLVGASDKFESGQPEDFRQKISDIKSLCLEIEHKQIKGPLVDGKETSCNMSCLHKESFDEWAVGAVFSGLISEREIKRQSIPPSDPNKHLDSDRLDTKDGLDASGRLDISRRDDSMRFNQLRTQTSKRERKGVTFRNHDSFIQNQSMLMKSGASIRVNEGSMDLETLIEDGKCNVTTNLSDMVKKNNGDLEFNSAENDPSIQRKGSINACEEMLPKDTYTTKISPLRCTDMNLNNCNMWSQGTSIGKIEFNYNNRNNLSMPLQYSAKAEQNSRMDAREELQPQCSYSTEPHFMMCGACNTFEHPTPEGHAVLNIDEEKKDTSCAFNDEKTSQRHEQPSDRRRRLNENNIQRGQSDDVPDTDHTPKNTHNRTPSEEDATEKNCSTVNTAPQYTIPRIVSASVIKERAEDKVGLVFAERRHRVTIVKMTTNCLFRGSNLNVNDEVLLINGHRIKNAQKAAEFIRESFGTLSITAFRGKRPRESVLEMMKLSESDVCHDIHLFTKNEGGQTMVHIIRVGGRFSRSGRIRTGDVILAINGVPVTSAERATELLRKSSKEVCRRELRRGVSDYDDVPDPEPGDRGLAIILVLSLSKLRCRLIKKNHLRKVAWNDAFDECAVQLPSGKYQRVLRIHNDGNCEDIIQSPGEVNQILLRNIQLFASTFYSQFQGAMVVLREAMQHAVIVTGSVGGC